MIQFVNQTWRDDATGKLAKVSTPEYIQTENIDTARDILRAIVGPHYNSKRPILFITRQLPAKNPGTVAGYTHPLGDATNPTTPEAR